MLTFLAVRGACACHFPRGEGGWGRSGRSVKTKGRTHFVIHLMAGVTSEAARKHWIASVPHIALLPSAFPIPNPGGLSTSHATQFWNYKEFAMERLALQRDILERRWGEGGGRGGSNLGCSATCWPPASGCCCGPPYAVRQPAARSPTPAACCSGHWHLHTGREPRVCKVTTYEQRRWRSMRIRGALIEFT